MALFDTAKSETREDGGSCEFFPYSTYYKQVENKNIN